MRGQIVGILLAAGESRRFGTDKLLYPLADGTPLVLASARALRAVLPSVVAVVRPGSAALVELLGNDGIATVVADNADAGMGASLARGIAATRDAAGWLIALGDMPFIRRDSIAGVAAALATGAAIAAPRYRGERGHPVGFAARLGGELLVLAGDAGAREVLRRHANDLVAFDCDDPGVLADIDSRSDLTWIEPKG